MFSSVYKSVKKQLQNGLLIKHSLRSGQWIQNQRFYLHCFFDQPVTICESRSLFSETFLCH